jgi:LuxR family maltose regulon positive regulatory protein
MLDTSVLASLTAEACAAVTSRQDAAALLRAIDTAHLFLVALDEERATFRYHRLVRQVLRAELRARDEGREQKAQLRAAEWFEAAGDTRQAAHHFLAAGQVDRALAPMQDQVMADFLHNPVAPARLELSMVTLSRLTGAPDQLLAVAADLLLWGDGAHVGRCFELLEQVRSSIPPGSRLAARFATLQSYRYGLAGQPDQAVAEALAARAIAERTGLRDEWTAAVPLILMRAHTFTDDAHAVAREAATALAMPGATEPITQVMVPGALALAWFQRGQLAKAADAARTADCDAQRLGFGRHFFAVDYLRVLAGLALERHDFDTAERLTERALSITEQRWPALEFLALLDRALIWAARGQTRDALDTVEAARRALAGTGSVLQIRADALEALLRLSLGDLRSPVELAGRLSPGRQQLLMARVALVAGDHRAAQEHLESRSLGDLTPRQELIRQLVLAGAAIERGDPCAEATLGGALHTARHQGFLNTVVTTAPQVTSYLIEHAARLRPDPFTDRLTAAARHVSAAQPDAVQPWSVLAEPLTATEQRILKLLPTSTYLQIADTLYVSRNTVKTHLRAIYHKLGATSRSQALARAADLRLI